MESLFRSRIGIWSSTRKYLQFLVERNMWFQHHNSVLTVVSNAGSVSEMRENSIRERVISQERILSPSTHLINPSRSTIRTIGGQISGIRWTMGESLIFRSLFSSSLGSYWGKYQDYDSVMEIPVKIAIIPIKFIPVKVVIWFLVVRMIKIVPMEKGL